MPHLLPYRVRRVDWHRAGDLLRRVRTIVFIEEQEVPEALEWDEWDAQCAHVLAQTLGGDPIGTGRLLPDGQVGRMAVLRPWRGQGVGGALLRELLAMGRERGYSSMRLNAQVQAMPFYQRFGFVAQGPAFLDAGIPHRLMWLRLS
jgi:predicted GNAT family N-acyltransferase